MADRPEDAKVLGGDDVKDPYDIRENPDGSADLIFDDEAPADTEFYANLVEEFEEDQLTSLALELHELVEDDKQSRERRDEQYAKAMQKTGLDNKLQVNTPIFEGASTVSHPMITEAAVDFSARAIKELWPIGGERGGPVKHQTIGKPTKERLQRAQRKSIHMNWQLSHQMRGFRATLEQLLTQLPMGGSQYLKIYWDPALRRPVAAFVPIDEVYLPYEASSYADAHRKTHAMRLTSATVKSRMRSGMYREVDLGTPEEPDPTQTADAASKIEGRDPSIMNKDEARVVYETQVVWDFGQGEGFAPYLITMDATTRKILAIYRNWAEDDQHMEPLTHMVEFVFIPWRGAYGIGLPHLIGGLSTAATGALRALLDAAHLSNIQTGAKLKGGSSGGQNVTAQIGQINEIDDGLQTDDIRKAFMPLPFAPPSPVLFNLLGFLSDAGRGMVQTTLEKIGEQNPNIPVGSVIALIEQGMTVFSAIHSRLHGSMQEALKVIHRLNRLYLTETEVQSEMGQLVVKREDYEGPEDVVPVSDPNIFTETQRVRLNEFVAQRALMTAQLGLYDMRKVEENFLESIRYPDAKNVLNPKPEPKRLNAVIENLTASLGRPVVAFPDQNHVAHIKAHFDFLSHPLYGQNPAVKPQLVQAMVQHVKEHILYLYVDEVVKLVDTQAKKHGTTAVEMMSADDPDVMAAYDDMLMVASEQILAGLAQMFAPDFLPLFTQLFQEAQQMAQAAMPQNPELLKVEQAKLGVQAKQIEVQGKSQDAAAKAQDNQIKAQAAAQKAETERAKIELEAKRNQTEAALKADENERQRQNMMIDAQAQEQDRVAKVGMNQADNRTALTIAQMEIDATERANAQQIELQREQEDRQFMLDQVDHARQTAQTEADREYQQKEADKDRKLQKETVKLKTEKVGVSTGTGINPGS